jgi:hypothetical protein
MTFLYSLLFHVCASCHWLTSSLNWTLIRAVLELYHPFTDAFLYMPSSHILIINVANCQFFPLPFVPVSQLPNTLWCWFSYTSLVATFRRLPTLPSLVSRQLSCCCIHTTSVLRAKSEPIINGYLAFLNLADPLQLLVPDFVTSLYTLPTCVICEQLFRWDKQLFALHVITYYSMPLATAFTCSILLCRCKDLLYGCIVTVFHPLDITRSHTGQCLLCLTPSCYVHSILFPLLSYIRLLFLDHIHALLFHY